MTYDLYISFAGNGPSTTVLALAYHRRCIFAKCTPKGSMGCSARDGACQKKRVLGRGTEPAKRKHVFRAIEPAKSNAGPCLRCAVLLLNARILARQKRPPTTAPATGATAAATATARERKRVGGHAPWPYRNRPAAWTALLPAF
jgi:hypothetical protein